MLHDNRRTFLLRSHFATISPLMDRKGTNDPSATLCDIQLDKWISTRSIRSLINSSWIMECSEIVRETFFLSDAAILISTGCIDDPAQDQEFHFPIRIRPIDAIDFIRPPDMVSQAKVQLLLVQEMTCQVIVYQPIHSSTPLDE